MNQFFLKTMLSVFDEDLGAPPHLAGASAAAAEYAATSGGRVSPQDADKVRWGGRVGFALLLARGEF